MTKVFVYGTLKKDFSNHYLIENCKFIGEALTCEKYQMYPAINYAFPFLIESEKANFIKGQVFEINEEVEERLDTLESYPILYLKKNIKVKLINEEKELDALVYIKNEKFSDENMDRNNPIKEWTKDISYMEN